MFLRAIDKIKLFVVCGLLNTIVTCGLNILFLLILKLGVVGYMGANIIGSLASIIFMFLGGGIFKSFGQRIRNGESKYLIRELFKMCYPEFDIPEKVPMPRPVDYYFENYSGPTRLEFKKDLDMSKFTGNQKWQMWCLERFLNMIDEGPENKWCKK